MNPVEPYAPLPDTAANDSRYHHDWDAEMRLVAYYLVLQLAHPKASPVKTHHLQWPAFRAWWAEALSRETWASPLEIGIPLDALAKLGNVTCTATMLPGIEQRVIRSAACNDLITRAEDALADLRERGAEALVSSCAALRDASAQAEAGLPGQGKTLSESIVVAIEQWKAAADGANVLIPMIPHWAQIGGWHRGKVHAVVGRSSEHKSSLLRASCEVAARAGFTTALFALEDDAEDMARRTMAANCTRWTTTQMMRGEAPYKGDHELTMGELGKVRAIQQSDWARHFFLDDAGAPPLSALLRRIVAYSAKGLAFVAIDYAQLIQPDNGRPADAMHWQRVTAELQRVAKQLNIAIVAALQIDKLATRESLEDNARPPMTIDALGGACWLQNCYGSICIAARNNSKGQRLIDWQVDKWKTGGKPAGSFYIDPARDKILEAA